MPLLAIETATQQMGVAVIDGGLVRSCFELQARHPHSVELPGAVTRVCEAAGMPLSMMEAVIVDIGPGSFTGLRIGLAFTKSLAFPRKLPLVGIPSLDVLAAQLPYSRYTVCPILDAKRGNVYAASYKVETEVPVKQSDYSLAPIETVLESLKSPVVFLGDGVPLWKEKILTVQPDARFAPSDLWLPRASTLARIGWQRFQDGLRDNAQDLVPMYLYEQTCQVTLSNRLPGAPRKPPKTKAA